MLRSAVDVRVLGVQDGQVEWDALPRKGVSISAVALRASDGRWGDKVMRAALMKPMQKRRRHDA